MKTQRTTLGVALGAALLAFAPNLAAADEPTTAPAPARTRVSLQLQQDPDATGYAVPVAVPVQDETYTTINTPMIAGGLVLFGAAYGGSLIAASQSDNSADDRLWVPIAGPWLDLSDRGDCNIQNSACDNETSTKVLLVADGVLQAAGAVAVVGGVLFPRTVHRSAPVAAMEHVKPIRVGQDGHGLAFATKF